MENKEVEYLNNWIWSLVLIHNKYIDKEIDAEDYLSRVQDKINIMNWKRKERMEERKKAHQ